MVDEIVVVNSGFNFPFFDKENVPLESVSIMLKEIDFNGKIHEIKGCTFEDAPELERGREGFLFIEIY